MDYKQALDFIHNTNRFGSKLGLDNMKHLLSLMGDPQDKIRYVHVAGTNGKGSTASYISSILTSAGYKTGLYISPYIERFTERIQIGNKEIAEAELARITGFVAEKIRQMVAEGMNHPTEFEVVTAIAFQYYFEQRCDIVVLEVGLGGRLDATNIIKTPEVAVITAIAADHTDILGSTLEEIAGEKAGIIKEDGRAVIYPQAAEIENILKGAALKRKSEAIIVKGSEIKQSRFGAWGQEFDYDGVSALKTTLIGDHQLKNAATAIEAVKVLRGRGWKITDADIREGISGARWPGRLEILMNEPLFLIDGAHNAHGAAALAEALQKYFPDREKVFILGVLKDKDYRSLIAATAGMSFKYITVTPESPRALEAEALAVVVREYCDNVRISDTIKDAVEMSLEDLPENGMVCSYGSLYYIGIVRGILAGRKK